MNTCTTPNAQPASTIFHPDFMHYVAIDEKGVKAFLRAIAVNAAGQAIILAANGIKVQAMEMPDMSTPARCRLAVPDGTRVNSSRMLMENASPARLLAEICCQISGAVAEFFFDESEHFGNLGLADIESSYGFLSDYESSHNIDEAHVLAACTVVVEKLLSQHRELAETMATQLFMRGSLGEEDMKRHLSGVPRAALGDQVLAALQAPWIEEEVERVHRMFFGS